MGPGEFQSINNGRRDRLAFFVEADSTWSKDLTTNAGLRSDIVQMDTGRVHGYNETDNAPTDARTFNSKSHLKTDHNYDGTLMSKLRVTPRFDLLTGIARKSRSPNLYERYAWAGSTVSPLDSSMEGMGTAMDMLMINWFGDGNGYVGNPGLRPEIAHKISTTFSFHDEGSRDWELIFNPYYSDIKNFIDADLIGTSNGNNFLRFANHDAVVFGADFSAKAVFLRHKTLGELSVKSVASYTRGYRKDGRAELYHLMPLQGKIAFHHEKGKWNSVLGFHLVNKKEQVNELRNEPDTAGYALMNLGTSYRFNERLKLDLSVTNLFDHNYNQALGGVDLVNNATNSREAVRGQGRSINTSLSMDFF